MPANDLGSTAARDQRARLHVCACALLLLALVAAPPARGADEEQRLEREALALEARTDYHGTFDAYARALGHARAAAAWERAEVYVEKLHFAARMTARYQDVVRVLGGLARAPGTPPLLAARARWRAADALLRLGRVDDAEALTAPLGFIRSYWVCGPFDNERGGGFATVYAPEEKGPVDLEARARGKVREVAWRAAPEAAMTLGVLDLDALVRPNDEVLAYALAYIENARAEPVWAALRVGSNEGLRAYWNDERVIDRDAYRTLELDQDAALVLLEPGWNKLLLKVAERTGPFAVLARLTAPDGAPIEARAAAPEELPLIAWTPPAARTAGAPAPALNEGGIAWYEARVKSPAASARDWFHLGYLRYRRGAHDEGEHLARAAYREAVARAPEEAVYRHYLALVLDSSGELDVSRELNPMRIELERVAALDPTHVRAALGLARYYLFEQRSPEQAEPWLERARALAPDSVEVALLAVALAERRGWEGEARGRLGRLAATADARRLPPEARTRAAEVLPWGERAAAYAGALAMDRLDGPRARLASFLEERGRHAEVEDLWREAVQLRPGDAGARLELAAFLTRRARLADAARELDAALALCPEDDEALERLGRLRRRQGDVARAVQHLEQALALNPGRTALRSYLELLREDAPPVEEAYRVELDEVLERAREIAIDREVPLRVLSEVVAIRIHEDGTSTRFTQRIARIENLDGARSEATQGFGFAAGEQEGSFRRASVVKADGRREEVRVDGSRSGRGFVSLTLPPLTPGDVVLVETRVADLGPTFFGDYFGHTHAFRRSVPVERARLVLLAPPERALYVHLRGAPPAEERPRDDGLIERSWALGPFPRIVPEPGMPGLKEMEPIVEVSTFRDWRAFGAWYWNLVKRQHEVSPELRKRTLELTEGRSTREDKIRAIYGFVVSEVRYNDHWEFGVHGFKPYNAATIYERRFGDCKDKATLINVMLSVVGIESWPVLIGAHEPRPREDLTLPLMTHFNHCIAYVPDEEGEGGWFLDGTAENHPSHMLPAMDYGATVLVVRPDGGDLKEIGFPTPLTDHGVTEQTEVELSADGEALVAITVRPQGGVEALLRGMLVNPARRREDVESLYARRFPGAVVRAVEASDLSDLESPVEIDVELRVPGLLETSEGGLVRLKELKSPLVEAMLKDRALDAARLSEREHDLLLAVPAGGREVVRYRLPEGLGVETLPEDIELRTPFGRYVKRYERRGREVTVTREITVDMQRIPAESYGAWRRFATDMERADDKRMELRRVEVER